MYIGRFLKHFFPAKNFYTILWPFEGKKMPKKAFFCKNDVPRDHFWSKTTKTFFSYYFIKIVKNVETDF